MIDWWVLLSLSLGYLMLLFAIAYWGDKLVDGRISSFSRSLIYSLSLAVYCTSWTFFGAVGSAAQSGWGYLPIYLGPILVFLFGWPLIRRMVAISKRQNLTSIADFIGARYGKSQGLAAMVTVMATLGSVPYIALQLKAIVDSFDVISNYTVSGAAGNDTALIVAVVLALFAILFGTRKIDVTEHHQGMMIAIAFESLVKLLAFVAIGLFAWFLLGRAGGPAPGTASPFSLSSLPNTFMTQLVLASAAIICLPRQFHVAIVEAHRDARIDATRWAFPLYLLVFSVLVIPITLAGLTLLPEGAFRGDTFVLALPMQQGTDWLTVLAFIGGFSAATGMVIVACVALATMVSNELVMPAVLRLRHQLDAERTDYSRLLLTTRRLSIAGIALLAYLYYRVSDESAALASIGLLSFAAAAQFMPLIALGMYSERVTRTGAVSGLAVGFLLWAYTLFLPTLARSGAVGDSFIEHGLFGLPWLRPEALLFADGLDPLTHGVVWSLSLNTLVFLLVSARSKPSMIETVQARVFTGPLVNANNQGVGSNDSQLSNRDLRELADQFLGNAHAGRSFDEFAEREGLDLSPSLAADRRLLQFTERLLAGAIGAASARIVITTALRKTGVEVADVVVLLDETSQAVRFNRQLTEATLENITQGVAVVDSAQRLIGWNSRYIELMGYPGDMVSVGTPVANLIRFNAERGRFGDADVDKVIAKRLRYMREGSAYKVQSNRFDNKVVEIRGQAMPDGGYVTTYTDITEFKAAEDALVDAKSTLEQRVADRTMDLERAMAALEVAKGEAEDANLSKTRFLAAAAHDLLQPLNAAKLFTALLSEHRGEMSSEQSELVERVENGLVGVEDLLSALLDISRLDTAAPEPKLEVFRLDSLFRALEAQFAPAFHTQGLTLRFAKTRLAVYSDQALLRRILQNFISNARRYTTEGGVLVGCRRRGGAVVVQVYDTGVGIAASDQRAVFEEFHRLSEGARQTKRGLGLGLAIVERIARLLDHKIGLKSEVGEGSRFEITVPRARGVPSSVTNPEPARLGNTVSIDGQLVLCIDNEPDILDGMQGLIEKWGGRSLGVSSTDEALAVMRAQQSEHGELPALLLVDYHLNDGDTGLVAIAALREEAGSDLPAAILTADRTDQVADRVREAGVDLLHKPVKPAALRALINRTLSRRSAA
ncbi:MAG: NahK/ErcS family hybrid sensor histidine kinase/response regulator [Pseudomonadota bacterium]